MTQRGYFTLAKDVKGKTKQGEPARTHHHSTVLQLTCTAIQDDRSGQGRGSVGNKAGATGTNCNVPTDEGLAHNRTALRPCCVPQGQGGDRNPDEDIGRAQDGGDGGAEV